MFTKELKVKTNNFLPPDWGQQLVDALNKSVREENPEPTRKDVLKQELEKKVKK